MDKAMTLTAARKLADQKVRYGYYRQSPTEYWQTCPLCAHKVVAVGWVVELRTPRQQFKAVRDELVKHLLWACTEAPRGVSY